MRLGLLVVTGSIGLGAVALPAWIVTRPLPAPALPAPNIPRLQTAADQACRCSRERGDEAGVKSCWAGYDKAVAPYAPTFMGTACGPESSQWDCFDEKCDRAVEIDRSPSGLCSPDERKVVAAIWAHELDGADTEAERQRAFDRANAATKRAFESFRLGRKVAMPPPPRNGEAAGC